MFMPSIRRNDLMDDFFGSVFRDSFGFDEMFSNAARMNVDVQEFDDKYVMDLELPGFEKEDIKADLNNGYLTVRAEHSSEQNEDNKEGNYIKRERYYGAYERSFFVGEGVSQDEIKASFDNGILKLDIPKRQIENKRQFIEIH